MAASKVGERISRSLLARLEAIECPYTEGVGESWIGDLIFTPGEPRLRLLTWLFSKIDPRLRDTIEPQYTMKSLLDSRIQRILFVACSMGLCRYDEVELIRGSSSLSRQTAFMDQLLDIVCILHASEQKLGPSLFEYVDHIPCVSDCMSLDEQFTNDCRLMDLLSIQERPQDFFVPNVNLLPGDLKKAVEKAWLDKKLAPSDWPVVPDIHQLSLMAEDITLNLQRQQKLLAEIKADYSFADNNEDRDKVNKTLQLSLSELSQLITGFSYSFENYMRPWCNKTAPSLSQLGPAFKRVHTMLQQFSKLLESLHKIRSSFRALEQENVPLKGHTTQSGQSVLDEFEDCISVLQQSLTRNQTGLHSTLHTSTIKMS